MYAKEIQKKNQLINKLQKTLKQLRGEGKEEEKEPTEEKLGIHIIVLYCLFYFRLHISEHKRCH